MKFPVGILVSLLAQVLGTHGSQPTIIGECALGSSLAPGCGPLNYCLEPNSALVFNTSDVDEDVICIEIYLVGSECYDSRAVCQKQINGQCGWSNEGDFAQCLQNAGVQPSVPIDPISRQPTELDGCMAIASRFCGPSDICMDKNDTIPPYSSSSLAATCSRSMEEMCFDSSSAVCARNATGDCQWRVEGQFSDCLQAANDTVMGQGNSSAVKEKYGYWPSILLLFTLGIL